MEKYNADRSSDIVLMILSIVLMNLVLVLIIMNLKVYTIASLLKVLLITGNLYQLYYLIIWMTLKYYIEDNNVIIESIMGLKKVVIPIDDIDGYTITQGKIKGVKLSGYVLGNTAIGRSFVYNIGTTRMFVTMSENVIFLKTNDVIYAISPADLGEFRETLYKKNIKYLESFNYIDSTFKQSSVYKDKNFTIPFLIVSCIIIIMTLIPLILYLKHMLPDVMPLSFDAKFIPTKFGSGKQFASQQMIYGALNMAVLFCMYYASHFSAKYDRKSSYRYIYLSLIIAVMFLLMQIKVLFKFLG